MRYLQYSFFIVLIVATSLCFADEKLALINCKTLDYKFKSNLLILHPKKTKESKLYLISNKKIVSLLLTHPDRRHITNGGWDSMLKAGNWSAFIVNRPDFAISCKPLQKNFQTKSAVSCAHVLTVCVYRHLKINTVVVTGTFWVAEDKSLKTTLAAVKKRLSS